MNKVTFKSSNVYKANGCLHLPFLYILNTSNNFLIRREANIHKRSKFRLVIWEGRAYGMVHHI